MHGPVHSVKSDLIHSATQLSDFVLCLEESLLWETLVVRTHLLDHVLFLKYLSFHHRLNPMYILNFSVLALPALTRLLDISKLWFVCLGSS